MYKLKYFQNKKDSEFIKYLNHSGVYKDDTKDPVLDKLTSFDNISYIQDALCDIMRIYYKECS